MNTPPIVSRPRGWDLVPTNGTVLKKVKNGAVWPYWIAGISAINDLLIHIRAPIHLAFGLSLTDFIYGLFLGLSARGGAAFIVIGGILDFGVLAAFAALGYFALRRQVWAFIAAIAVLSFDALLVLAFAIEFSAPFLLSLAVHVIAVAFMWVGLKHLRIYRRREREGLV